MNCSRLLLRVIATCGLAFHLGAYAQTPEQLLRGIINATRQGQSAQTPVPYPMPGGQPAAQPGITPPAQPLWPSKAAFLDDARTGRLLGYNGINLNDERRVGGSLYAMGSSSCPVD